jgi:hypothetical protein
MYKKQREFKKNMVVPRERYQKILAQHTFRQNDVAFFVNVNGAIFLGGSCRRTRAWLRVVVKGVLVENSQSRFQFHGLRFLCLFLILIVKESINVNVHGHERIGYSIILNHFAHFRRLSRKQKKKL